MAMDEVNRILRALERGDPETAEQLLPLVYRELRELAARRLAREAPGQTLEPTALVHEVYLRLVGAEPARSWDGRRHFFAAAAEAMRRILVENARHKKRLRHGGARHRVDLDGSMIPAEPTGEESLAEDLLALDEALEQLGRVDRQAAELVKLRYFSGLSTEQAAEVLELPERSAYRKWAFARAWLYRQLHAGDRPPVP
jgi:RNA polymerase sigma factor (TIGR02999 family)